MFTMLCPHTPKPVIGATHSSIHAHNILQFFLWTKQDLGVKIIFASEITFDDFIIFLFDIKKLKIKKTLFLYIFK